jgi:poly(3-hydroxybutyrate) depolymerase
VHGPAQVSSAWRPPSDHLTVTAAGAPAYRLDGDLSGGGISVLDNVATYETDKVQGQGTLPGAHGGTATVNIQITHGLLGLSGTFALNDPQAQVQITANVFGNVTAPADGTITWQANGTVKRGTRSATEQVGFTLLDRHPDPGDHAIRITHAGQKRNAILRLPDNYDGTPRPVLFHFPGLGETPGLAEYYGRMADFAQTRGFIMITPEHYGLGWQGVAGGPTSPDVDDPGFVTELQDILIQRFNADPRRLYASGMSNGGFFTSKMACDNKRFAAYVPVSGQLNDQAACHPGRPVPIVLIHGDGDPLVPYSTAPEAARFWAGNNGCGTATTDTDLPDIDPNDNTTVTRHDYRDCPASAPVILYQIKGGGHNWPGGIPFLGPVLGGTTYDISANTVIWDFVSRFHL